MDNYSQIATQIIKQQEAIIGPVALEQAQKVSGLKINLEKNEVSMEGDKKVILENLVKQYEHLFGRASIEVCRDAIRGTKSTIDQSLLPDILR